MCPRPQALAPDGVQYRVRASVLFSCSLFFGFGCLSSPREPASFDLPNDQIWTSTHFRYASRAEDPGVCIGVVDQLEAHLQAVSSYLGLTWQGDVIRYYKFRDNADFIRNAGCGELASGCSLGPLDVRSADVLDDHELIHAYLRSLGSPPAMFEEGIARALAPGGRYFWGFTDWNWRDILATPRAADAPPDSDTYSAGGWFVTYLLRQFGPAPFLAFYAASGQTANISATEVASHFKDTYGRELDDVWSEAKTNAPFLFGVPVWACASAKPMGLAGDLNPVTGACDGSGNFGALELAVPTTFTWTDTAKLEFGIVGCSPVDGLYTAFSAYFGVGAVAFPAGKYYVAPGYVSSPPDDGGTAATFNRTRVGFLDASGALGPDCNAVAPFALSIYGAQEYDVAIANSAIPWFAKPQIMEGGSFHVNRLRDHQTPTWDLGKVATVELCDTCAGPCQVMDDSARWTLSNGMVLRFTNLDAREGVTVTRLQLWL